MSHKHTLPTSIEEVQPCISEMLQIVTGNVEFSVLEVVTHGSELVQFGCYLLGADRQPLIMLGHESEPMNLSAEQQNAIDACLAVLPKELLAEEPKGGPLAGWALRLIIQSLIEQLLEFFRDMIENDDIDLKKWGDGSILKVILEQLPIIAQIIDED